jgi:magnesium transporter
VVDDNRTLLGFVSLRDLIVARRDVRVRDLIHEEVIFARADEDQEEAARKIQKFDLIALPVVNGDNALVGIITYDDAIDVITQEHTEDMEKMMAIGGSHEGGAYLRMSPWEHFRNRAGWVAALGVVGLLSGFIVQQHEGLLRNFALLAAFMPMLAGAGGNTGSQSAALIVRGLALEELSPRDLPRILLKELQISLLIGALLGGIVFARVLLHGGVCTAATVERIGLTIAIAVGLQVVTATLVGALLPMIAAKLKFDPAVVANPALATIVDVTGMLIYFSVAGAMLGA